MKKSFLLGVFFVALSWQVKASAATSEQLDEWLYKVQTFGPSAADSALFYLSKIEKHLAQKPDPHLQLRYLLVKGSHKDVVNQYDSALVYYNKALTLAQSDHNLSTFQGTCFSLMASLFNHYANYTKALEYQLKAIKFGEDRKDDQLYIDYNTLASIYQNLGKDSLALRAYMKAKVLTPKDNYSFIASFNSGLFLLYMKAKNYANARRMQMEVQPWLSNQDIFNDYDKVVWYLNQSKYYLAVDSVIKAENALNSAEEIVDEANNKELDMYFNGYVESYYLAKQDYKNAHKASIRYYTLKDSLEGIEVQNNLANLQTKYATAEKERKISEQKLILEKSESRQQLLIIILSALALIAVLLIYFYINSRKKRTLLAKQNVQIQKAHAEIENLIRESHHRIKNNLQVVSSLLKMQSKNVSSADGKASLLEAYNRVQTIAVLHQKLQGSQSFKTVNLKDFTKQIVEAIKQSLLVTNSNIQFKINVESKQVKTDMAISLGLIINELVTNAIKYAFQESNEGLIQVDLFFQNGGLSLVVSDSGIGFPIHFDFNQPTSLGFKIVRSMATKLQAKIDTRNDKGARIEISIPYEKAA